MKKIIKKLVRSLGFDIIKYSGHKKSINTQRLSYHKTKTGNYFLPQDAYSDIIANTIKDNRVFEQAIYDTASKYIKKGTIALDVGSNFGQMAILMSKLVGDEGIVHAFEADDFVFKILEKNANENSNNIIVHFGAIHNISNETLYFPIQDFKRFSAYGSYGIDYINGKGRPVRTIALDDIDFMMPISFMKIDIQGGDLYALEGAVRTIEKHKMPIIFEYEYQFEDELKMSFQNYVDFVKRINYRFEKIIYGQNYLILPNI